MNLMFIFIIKNMESPVILIIDDTSDNLNLLRNLFNKIYKTRVTNSGERGVKILEEHAMPDLILLDVMMPGIDGYEVCRLIKANPRTKDIIIIFLTAKNESINEEFGLALGTADFISKPIHPSITLARVNNQLKIKAADDYLKNKSEYLDLEVIRRVNEISKIQDATIMDSAEVRI